MRALTPIAAAALLTVAAACSSSSPSDPDEDQVFDDCLTELIEQTSAVMDANDIDPHAESDMEERVAAWDVAEERIRRERPECDEAFGADLAAG